MSQWEKLIERIRSLSKETRFNELKKVLERCGYEMRPAGHGGSHVTFRKKGRNPITVPKKDPVKTVYVEMVRDAIPEEEKEHEND